MSSFPTIEKILGIKDTDIPFDLLKWAENETGNRVGKLYTTETETEMIPKTIVLVTPTLRSPLTINSVISISPSKSVSTVTFIMAALAGGMA